MTFQENYKATHNTHQYNQSKADGVVGKNTLLALDEALVEGWGFVELETIYIRVKRKWETTKSTTSEITIDNTDFSAFVLEENGPSTATPDLDRRIPTGTFNLIWHYSKQYNGYLKLYNDVVPASRGILIHIGNNPTNTAGCLLVGNTKAKNFVGDSINAHSKFLNTVIKKGKTKINKKGKITNMKLIITDEFKK
nr:DUF5675 family protein [Sulfurimonas sp.]